MKFRTIDSNGDWTFGKGLNNYSRDINAIELDVITRIKSWKYDCYFAMQEGIDYKNFLERGQQLFLESDLKRYILQTNGIIRINSFSSSLDRETRKLTIQTFLLSIYGPLKINVPVV